MAYLNKEEFEAILKEQYEMLDKAGFAKIVNASQIKLQQLLESKDIIIGKNPDDEDDYIITHCSNQYYEIAFKTFQFVKKTRKLSFKQYKALCAFINAKTKVQEETEYKQF